MREKGQERSTELSKARSGHRRADSRRKQSLRPPAWRSTSRLPNPPPSPARPHQIVDRFILRRTNALLSAHLPPKARPHRPPFRPPHLLLAAPPPSPRLALLTSSSPPTPPHHPHSPGR